MAIRAIFDTNVFVGAGFNRHSASARLIEAARAGQVRMIWCPATRHETRRILDKIPRLSFAAVSDLFDEAGEAPDPGDLDQVAFVADPEDRKFALLSLETGATLVSSDDDLLSHAGRLDVLKPSAFAATCGLGHAD